MRADRKLISQIIKLEDDIGILQRAYAVTNDSWKQQQSELQEYHELTLAQTAKIRELKAELTRLRKVAEVAIEYLSDRHIVTTRDMEEALNNYEAWKDTQK